MYLRVMNDILHVWADWDFVHIFMNNIALKDLPSCGGKATISTENHRYQCIIKIGRCIDCVEWALCQCAFRSSSCCRRWLASYWAYIINEELRQLLVVNRIEHTKWTNLYTINLIWRVVPSTTNYSSYREDTRFRRGDLAVETCPKLC